MDRHRTYIKAFRQHDADDAAQLGLGKFVDGGTIDDDIARDGRLEGTKGAQEGALAYAIGTQEADKVAFWNEGVDTAGYDVFTIARSQIS